VATVVYGREDPDLRVAGRGVEILRGAGIEVRPAEASERLDALLAPYFRWKRVGLPWIVAKWAMTLDGRIATRTGSSRWISGEAARRRVHETRNLCSSVWVGVGTALADDPHLTCRREGGRQPLRVVVDSHARLPVSSKLVESSEEGPVMVAVTEAAPRERIRALEERGVEVVRLRSTREDRVDLEALAREMVRRSRVRVLVEGGGELLGSLFENRLVDEVEVYLAAKIVGGSGAHSPVGGRGVASIAEAWRLVEFRTESIGEDVLLRGRVDRHRPS
jgi:diaminohydroxyphosphoribosylaminopyrimidine deaminase/5-amino-6-(5-phosphoribosylamino)uracil reductase